MKKYIFMLMLLLIPVASAITFPEDTTFSNGDIDFTFKEGLEINDFKLISSGIIVDDYRIVIAQEGGELSVVFEEWDGVKKISVESNVPQELSFKITSDGQKYYVYDGNEYVVDKYDIDVERVEWTFSQFEENRLVDEVIVINDDSSWWDTTVFFFEVPELSTGTDNIGGKLVVITYKSTVIFTLFIVGLILLIAWRGRK